MKMKSVAVLACLLASVPSAGLAAKSGYSKLDSDKHCKFSKPTNEEEEGMGTYGVCKIDNVPVIYIDEGDLRQSAGFGAKKNFESFGQFNRMNNVIEWRYDDLSNPPQAAIVRWFIENVNSGTGLVEKQREGQVLVVHKVAQDPSDSTCVVGMVDARANKNANELARKVADTMAADFRCGTDEAKYHGVRGPYSGDPSF